MRIKPRLQGRDFIVSQLHLSVLSAVLLSLFLARVSSVCS